VRIEWTPTAVASARRYMHDQDGMRAIGTVVATLADIPYPSPPEGFHRGRYHRLRAGSYRIMYVVDDNVITVERVDWLVGAYLGRPDA
jgi:mRNA-degrading endonuclease RelE of RelBE toxin-antitoxin system